MGKTQLINEILGSEYSVAIDKELDELKQSDRMLLGDIVAVVRRTDKTLGRPSEDCTETDNSGYIIFKPSKYSIICNKDFGAIRNKNSEWVLMSLNYFVTQLLEFNFTYLQVLKSIEVYYESKEFIRLKTFIDSLLTYDNDAIKLYYRKLTSLIIGVCEDLNKGKFKDEKAIRNRVFLVYACICIIYRFVSNDYYAIHVINRIYDKDEYNKIVKNCIEDGKLKAEVQDWLTMVLK